MNQSNLRLQEPAYTPLSLGKIKPLGWLRHQLEIQAEGMTGLLPEYWEPLGPNSGWLGGGGESWERGPYYLDGLVPLAYLLDDTKLIRRVERWIEWTLSSQRGDGMFGPSDNDDWWPRMVMAKVLTQYEEATHDPRVTPFLLRYLRHFYEHLDERPLSDWGQARAGEAMVSALWLYRRTKEAFLLQLIEKLHLQSIDWTSIFTEFPFWRYQTKFDHRVHVVNVAMGLKEPALYSLVSSLPLHREAPVKGIRSLNTYHGQLNGMFSGDEWLAGTSPSQGTELCAVMEYLYSLEQLYSITGNTELFDIIERVAFNALPATIGKDWMSHQYVQQVNQIACTSDRRNWTENRDDANMFGLEPNFGCCTANMHQGWPKLAASLWHRKPDGTYLVSSYAPCRVTIENGGTFTTEGGYPFQESASIVYHGPGCQLSLELRRPTWCVGMTVDTGSGPEPVSGAGKLITRSFQDGDTLTVQLPMKVRTEQRANQAVGVLRGPLLYSIPFKENWVRRSGSLPFVDWEVFPSEGQVWNYALALDTSLPDFGMTIHHSGPIPRQPFQWEQSPLKLTVKAKLANDWKKEQNSAGELPISPVKGTGEWRTVSLYPYGGCRLRMTELPVLAKEEKL